ncbi:MAG: alpha/beta hydrolase [Oligoflexia bacterium]|nr:alpha/beta hydrolase [Oligoflexia bacterium]
MPQKQAVDIRNAVTYIQSLENVDPENVSLWGSSFGGANAVYVAVTDSRVKSIAVQLTFASGERMIKGKMNDDEKAKIDGTLQKARTREVVSNKKLSLKPDQILTDEDSKSFYAKMSEIYPQMQVKIPITTLGHILELKPEEVISGVRQPVLIIAAENDIVCPASESEILFEKANNPKEFVLLKNARHFDTYTGENFNISAQRAVEWFRKH